jgi:hypothetical protein
MGNFSEPFGAYEGVDEIEKDAHRHQRAQEIVKNHDCLSKPVADIGIKDRQHEKGEAGRQEDHVKHGRELRGRRIRIRDGSTAHGIRKT